MTKTTIFVVGAHGAASRLSNTARFADVVLLADTGQLKAAIENGTLNAYDPKTAVFLFADTTPVTTPGFDVPLIVERLAGRDWKVALLAMSGVAGKVVEQSPSAGLITAPFTVNGILGALTTFTSEPLEPVSEPWAFETFDPTADAAPEVPTAEEPQPAAPASWADALANDRDLPDVIDTPAPADMPATVEEPAVASEPASEPVSWAANWQSPAATTTPSEQEPVVNTPVSEPAEAPAADMFSNSWASNSMPDAPAEDETPAEAPASQPEAAPVEEPTVGSPAPEPAPQSEPSPPMSFSFGGDSAASFMPTTTSSPTSAQTGDHSYWAAAQEEANLVPAGHGKVISVTVAKGGAGKSTLTTNLGVFAAIQLRKAGKRVVVVDANWQQSDVSNIISMFSPNIRDIADNPQDITKERIEQYLVDAPGAGPCRFLLGPSTVNEASPTYITPRLFSNVTRVLRGLFDYIIVDTPVSEYHHSLFTNFVLKESDFILSPINPDNSTVVNAHKWLEEVCLSPLMGGAGYDPDRVGYVVNRASDEVGYSTDQIRADMGPKFRFLGQIDNDPRWQRAANAGELMVLSNDPNINLNFAAVLYNVTGEEVFREIVERAEAAAASRKKKRRGLFGR